MKKGKEEALIHLVNNGLLDINTAAVQANLSVDEFKVLAEKHGFEIK